ncbi:hypothetical protein JYU14_03560 [Simkania negevensis]|uniref:Aspartate/glutamate/uridylate kinase domain-containing protein n=1 Tax=Simkania negevensis TaxID=83561 RepID=A0ABS3AQX8_9BACT|nr:hypothetical protein [Simkania negevensis]
MSEAEYRKLVSTAKRIVVKVGTRLLLTAEGMPNLPRIRVLVNQLALLSHAGKEVVFVTSGAIGAGMQALQMKRRPTALHDLQMMAAVQSIRISPLRCDHRLLRKSERTVLP